MLLENINPSDGLVGSSDEWTDEVRNINVDFLATLNQIALEQDTLDESEKVEKDVLPEVMSVTTLLVQCLSSLLFFRSTPSNAGKGTGSKISLVGERRQPLGPEKLSLRPLPRNRRHLHCV